MNLGNRFSQYWLHAYVDDELSPADRLEVLQMMRRDETLRTQIHELQDTKELVRQAFMQPPEPANTASRRDSFLRWRPLAGMAAVLFLMIFSFALGRFTESVGTPPSLRATLNQMGAVGLQKTGFSANPKRVLLHVASENHVTFTHTLDQAKKLLATYGNQGMKVELIVNGGALELLRAGNNPYAQQIHALLKKYPNLHVVACGAGLNYLNSKNGFPIELMHQVRVAPSAVQEIVKRLRQGWFYVNA